MKILFSIMKLNTWGLGLEFCPDERTISFMFIRWYLLIEIERK